MLTYIILDWDLITPILDGTILPGVTRDSVLALAASHTNGTSSLSPNLPKIHQYERRLTMFELLDYHRNGDLLEAFGSGTAAIICPVKSIGYDGSDIYLPSYAGGFGPVARAMWERIVEIQEGRRESDWSVVCEE